MNIVDARKYTRPVGRPKMTETELRMKYKLLFNKCCLQEKRIEMLVEKLKIAQQACKLAVKALDSVGRHGCRKESFSARKRMET